MQALGFLSLLAFLFMVSVQALGEPSDLQKALGEAEKKVNFDPKTGLCSPPAGTPANEIKQVFVVVQGDKRIVVKIGAGETAIFEIEEKQKSKIVISTKEDFDRQLNLIISTDKNADITTLNCDDLRAKSSLQTQADVGNKCSEGDCRALPAVGKTATEVVSAAKGTMCKEEDKKSIFTAACWDKGFIKGLGGCAGELLWGGVKAILDGFKFIYGGLHLAEKLLTKGIDLVAKTHINAKIEKYADLPKYIEDWWQSSSEAEDRSSNIMEVVAHTDKEDIHELAKLKDKRKSEGSDNFVTSAAKKFGNFIFSAITTNFGCTKWSGLPHMKGSVCLEPWKGMGCADCWTRLNLFCGVAGYLEGEIGSAFLFGKFMRFLSKGIMEPGLEISGRGADRIQLMLSRVSKVKSPLQGSIFEEKINVFFETLTKAGNKITAIKTTGSDAVANFIETVSDSTSPFVPSHVYEYSGAAKDGVNQAVKWYLRKLDVAFAKGNGGAGQMLLVRQAHAASDLKAAQKTLKEAEEAVAEAKTGGNGDDLFRAKKNLRQSLDKVEKLELDHERAKEAYQEHNLRTLPNRLADKLIADKKKLLRLTGQRLTKEEFKKLKEGAAAAGELDQAKNLAMATEVIRQINAAPNASLDEIANSLGSMLHDGWRAARERSHQYLLETWLPEQTKNIPTMASGEKDLFLNISDQMKKGNFPRFEPRFKAVTGRDPSPDDKFVDIANTPFNELPPPWQEDNFRAGQNLANNLFKYKNKDRVIPSPLFKIIDPVYDVKDPDYLNKIAKVYQKVSTQPGVAKDPLTAAAARELKDFQERSNMVYNKWIGIDGIGQASYDYYKSQMTGDSSGHTSK